MIYEWDPAKRHANLDKHGINCVDADLACIIQEDFYCNRRYASMTSLRADGLARQSVNILFQVCLPPSRLHAPVSRGVSAVSSRTLVKIMRARVYKEAHGKAV